MKIRRLVVGTSVLSLVAGPTALLPMTAGADDNAATANMTVGCEARPAVTVGSQGGLPAVVPGERVTLHSSAHFDAGTVYQAALTRPDGSRYFAAAIELTPEVSAVFSPDANSLLLTQDGTPIALSSGTQPAVGTFVFDTSAPVGTYRVFFPGDAATMLADPQGFGLASFVVGPAGMSLDLAINGTVNDVPSSISGAVLPIGRCQQSVSSGPSNRSVQEQFASVGITEPTIELTKATASPAVAPGGIARWSLRVAAPARTAAGNLVAPAQGVVIVDAIPVGLEPVDDGGGALADGGSTSSGGVWSVGARTLTWSLPTVAAGANQTLSYSTRVDSGFNPLDSTVLTNNASATYRSLPAVSGGGRSYSAGPVSQNVVVGIMPPQIAKSVNRPHVGFGTEVTYTVDVTIPASAATDYSATIVDRLPSGLSFVAVDSITCVSGCPGGDPAPATLPSYVAGTGETTWGIYLGNLAPSADRVYQVTYRAMTAASATAAYGYGTTLTNSASISFDAQDRLGGAVPNTAALPLWDVTRTATADITLDRPTLTIKKSLISSPNPWDPNSNRVVFQLDVENTSTMNATNILIEDQQPEEWWVDTGGIMADGGAIFNVLGDWPLLSGTLDSVPAGATVHITIPISYRSGERLGLPISYVNTARISEYTDEFGSVINSRPGSPYVIPASSASVTPLVPHLSITKSVPTIVATSSLVTYTVTVTNDSDATATNIQIDDRFGESADSQWDYQEGSAVGGGVIEQWGWGGNENFVLPDLAPHSSATFTYQVLAPDHVVNTQRNTVDIRWSDGGGHWGYQLCTALKCDYRDFHATASAVTDVAVPQLSLVKGPKEDSFVPAGGTVVFNVDVTNPGSVPLTNVDITDVMPATLTYLSHSATTTGGPFTIAVDSSDPSNPHFTIPVLPPGAALHLLITARQDGSAPPGTGPDRFELVNVASAIADQIPTPVTDTGSTLYVPNIVRPTLSKTVSPAVAKPGDVVDWAVTIDVPSNVVDMYDEVIIDKVPDGLTAITPTSVTCNSGPCPTVTALSPMLPAPLPVTGDHATYAGWWLGDVPAGTAFNLTIHYTTQIESALDDGTLVLDGQATEPLDNRARGFYNTSDTYATESDVATFLRAPNSKWNGRTIVAKAEVDIVTPNVTIEKTMTTHQKWTWKNQAGLPSTTYAASAGDTLGYQLRVCNIGSSTAYDTTIVDDMGLGNLRSVTINPSAAAIVDGWSDPDPTATWALASLAPGACENITYSGTSWDSAHLIPAYSGVNSDVAAITNTATIGAFHTVPAAGVGDIIYGPRSAAPVTTLIMTPFVRVRGECAQADRGVAKTFTTRFWAFADGGVLWTPRDAVGLDPSIGGLHNARIEMWLAPGLEFVPGSVRASGQHMGTATPVAFRDPDSVTTAPDGRTILRWDEPYLEYQSTLNASLELSMSAINQSASPTAQVPVGGHLSGLDGNGSGSRGHAVVADYDYLDEHYGCGGRQLVISKRPEPGRPYYDTWKFFPDESFDFWGSWVGGDSADANGRGRISTSAVVTDTMPDGPAGYVPGSAQFTLYRMDGTTTTFTAASLSETITNLPGGRTRIEWTNWPEAHYRVDYRIPGLSVPAARTDLLNTTLTNDIRIVDPIDWPGALSGACGLPAATSCDTAPIFIKGPTQVNVTKVVDDETPHEWGTTRTWTVTATVKAGSNLNEFTVIDDQAWSSGFSPTFDPFLNGAYLSASCIGCPGTDPAITTLPRIMNGTGHAMGWSMGDLPPAGADRIYTLRYTTISSPLADAPVGFTADSANKILRFENSATARWTALDVPAGYDPVAQGTNWWISLQDSGNTCVLSGGCTESDADVRGIQLGFPWLTLTKDCVSVDGSSYVYDLNNAEYGDTVHPEPPRNLPGQPNLTCHLAVTNSGAAPAVNFAVRDTPDPVGDYWGSNPQWWPNNPSPVAWEVLSATGPFPASTTWGDSGSSFIAWAAGPADPIEPGETWEFNLTMHVDGWSGDPGQSSNYGRNQSTLSSWTDENGNAIGSPTTRSEVAHFVRPEVRLDKGFWKQPTSTTSDGLDFWSLQSLVAQPLGGPEFAMVGATQSVALLARVARPTQIGSLAVADELPGHMSYVPGSARLQHIVSIDPSFNTAPTIISIPIPDPARSTASVSPDRCTSGARGETLTWNFSASGTGWERAPWDTAFQYLTEAQSSEISYGDGGKTLVVFDVVAASDLFIACPATNTAGAPVVVTENRGMLTATVLNNDTLQSNNETTAVILDPLGVRKTPDAGAVIAGQTGGFDVEVWDREFSTRNEDQGIVIFFCSPPYTDPSDCTLAQGSWESPLDPGSTHVMQHATVTDVMTDYGLFDTTSEPVTLTMVPPPVVGLPQSAMTLGTHYTQTVTRLDANHVKFTWDIFKMPQPAVIYDPSTGQYVDFQPGTIRIHVPLRTPAVSDADALPNGTVINNTSSMTVNGPAALPGAVWPTTPIVVADTGAFQIVTPSLPPTPVKTASPTQAVGGLIDYSVQLRLPASQVWFDLAYTDLMPAGTELDSMGTASCALAGGGTCDAIPSMAGAPTVRPDGTTKIGWWFGDLGSADQDRIVTLPFRARLVADPAHGAPLAPGDVVTNTVRGYSNSENRLDDATSPSIPIETGDYESSDDANTTVVQPQLTITKAAAQTGPLSSGDAVSWTVTVHNAGTSTAYGVEVRDTPNAAIINVAEAPSSGFLAKGWTTAAPTLEWFVPTIPAGGDQIFQYSGEIGPNAISDGFVDANNTADIVRLLTQPAGTPKLRVLDGPEADATVPLAAAHLSVTKFAGSCSANTDSATVVGAPIHFCVTVHNAGTRDAIVVDLVDVLPAGWKFDSGSGTPADPATITGTNPLTLTWQLGTVVAGGSVAVEYDATPQTGAALTAKNLALVSAEMPSGQRALPGTPGYSAESDTGVQILSAGLEISKLPDFQQHAFLPTGGDVPFTIQVGSNTTTDLNGTVVTDTLPAPLTYTPGSATSTCNGFTESSVTPVPTGTAIRWTVNLPAGTSCTISLPTHHPGGRVDEHRVLNHVEAAHPLVPLVANQAIAEFVAPASLGDRVWKDTNGNGIQDAGESGIAGVTVTLHDNAGLVVGTTTTDADGKYLFSNLEPGTYRVAFTNLPPGLVFTLPHVGAGDLDSDADPSTGLTQTVTLASGDVYLHLDAGLVAPTYDLSVTKRAVTAAISKSGGTVDFAIDVANAGPGEAVAPIVVTDVMPAGMSATSVTAPDGWLCVTSDQIVTCSRAKAMTAGITETIQVATTVTATLASTTTIVNNVTATTKGVEVTNANNSGSATVQGSSVTPPAPPTTPPAPPTTPSTPPSTPRAPGGSLPTTGADTRTLLWAAALALAAGALASAAGVLRRRRTAH